MERLTYRNQDVSHVKSFLNKHSNFDGTRIANCLVKLTEYEDTELTPEEIKTLQADRDYWEREAKKWCGKLGEIRELTERSRA